MSRSQCSSPGATGISGLHSRRTRGDRHSSRVEAKNPALLSNRDANEWSGESIIQKWATALVGIAITPRFHLIKDKERRREVNTQWADFVREADADCVLDLYGMQTLAVRSWLERGEMFARRRNRLPSDGLSVPMQVQLLESDMVPNFDADQFGGLAPRNRIRSGIEFDVRGQRVAYWVYREHPGDAPTRSEERR